MRGVPLVVVSSLALRWAVLLVVPTLFLLEGGRSRHHHSALAFVPSSTTRRVGHQNNAGQHQWPISPSAGFSFPFWRLEAKKEKTKPTDADAGTATADTDATITIDVDKDNVSINKETALEPQVMATGYSQAMELVTAIQEATDMALEALPPINNNNNNKMAKIDLAFVSVSSLYDGNASPSDVVPSLLEATSGYGQGIQHLIGCTNGGFISSLTNFDYTEAQQQQATAAFNSDITSDMESDNDEEDDNLRSIKACSSIEREGVPGVTVMLAILPDVTLQTFHVMGGDVPDDYEGVEPDTWKESVGLKGFHVPVNDTAAMMVFPSPAFQKSLDDFLRGMEMHVPTAQIFGAIASTVSSLTRARLFRYDVHNDPNGVQTFADGCIGIAMTGDVQVKTMTAQGAKPVGGVYQVVKGKESTISAIALDEAATALVQQAGDTMEEEEEEEEAEEDDGTVEGDEKQQAKAKMAQAYAKARIPKPVLAEANFLMRTLSDDDQAFMRKTLLVGIERGGSLGSTPSELVRLAEGKGHGFTVHQVASANMKDGSVTLSMGSVDIQSRQRLRFYVRESAFAKQELEALWMGHKRRVLKDIVVTEDGTKSASFTPTGCFLFPTIDRGSKFFSGKTGYESDSALQYLPTLPCITGFYSNGVIGSLDSDHPQSIGTRTRKQTSLSSSASGYVLFGSKSGRPIYVPGRSAAKAAKAADKRVQQVAEETRLAEDEAKRDNRRNKSFDIAMGEKTAPRNEDGELVLRRREVHSGRAMTVSTVEWSVAENMATPTSALEGFMWDKETEVDRFRERVPLSNLVSQCRLSAVDPSTHKSRDWVGPILEAAKNGSFVIIPECKRTEPITGSLRKRYDVGKLAKEFTLAGVSAMSVNCDPILFGGSLEDLTKARDTSVQTASETDGVVAPPILASDLLLYPYQLYQKKLAGADAVNLVVAPLEAKDLVYLTKIASSLQMQTFVTVTSTKQIENIGILPAGSVDGIIVSNRELEDFSFDLTGTQALDILKSDVLTEFKAKQGKEIPILVEGRIGMIKSTGGSTADYIEELRNAGATGAIIGGGLVPNDGRKSALESLLQLSKV